MPLGISFFTFTQLAFIIDCYYKKTTEKNFLNYSLFVTYFPHLVAGPVLHHADMTPQFSTSHKKKIDFNDLATGIVLFIMGLFKKVCIADELIPYVKLVFEAANDGSIELNFIDSTLGALSYTFQLYFDFSGYSDMALGLSLLFGIKLPVNFDSPYKAKNIIEFWRRWHITLSNFLRDYLYIPLGGNRKGDFRKHANLLFTMLLGGLWHGAGWTFVIWGGLHGTFLVINHLWGYLKQKYIGNIKLPGGKFISRLLTFSAVIFAWIFFRAESLEAAFHIMKGFLILPESLMLSCPYFLNEFFKNIGFVTSSTNGLLYESAYGLKQILLWNLILFGTVWYLPNSNKIASTVNNILLQNSMTIKSVRIKIILISFLFSILTIYIMMSMNKATEFIYWQF